uniref:Hemicentin-1 n=1 Tax=Magallana gigas TaxID=29159 RepID=K1S6Y6_MAGGI
MELVLFGWRCEHDDMPVGCIKGPPKVHMLSQQDILEGRNLSVTCKATPGNPSLTTFYWTKVDIQGFRQNGATLHIPNIQRNSSGTYRCTAENSYNPPVVNTLFQQDIIEGRDLSVNCTATPGNPSSTAFYWTKVDNSGFRQNGPTLQLLNIQRNSSRTYICIAENMYSNGNKGTDNQSMVVNVIYQPAIENRQLQIVNESETVILTRNISGNPVSNVSWFNKTELLKTETSVTTTSFFIERPTCSDTQNFTLVASNGVGSNATAVVELIVNYGTNISYRFHDKGENELHAAHISNLQPLVTYWFVVSAKNSYGSSPSEITRCKTVQEKASSKTGMVVGSVGGALVLITIVLILGIVHRRFTCICKIALENKDRNMYDALTSTENANQYEDILKKDLKDDKFVTQNTEEYANTSFME